MAWSPRRSLQPGLLTTAVVIRVFSLFAQMTPLGANTCDFKTVCYLARFSLLDLGEG